MGLPSQRGALEREVVSGVERGEQVGVTLDGLDATGPLLLAWPLPRRFVVVGLDGCPVHQNGELLAHLVLGKAKL